MGDLIQEILDAIAEIAEIKFSAIWNNQASHIEAGEIYSFEMPSAFIEIVSDQNQDLGFAYQGSDITVNIHLMHEYYNGGQMEQDFNIFSLRDLIIKKFCKFKASKTGVFIKINETQDFEHTNVYHYVVGFKTHFIDDTAVPEQYYKQPPTDLTVTRNG